MWPRQLFVIDYSQLSALRKLFACSRDGREIVPSFVLAFGRIGQDLSVEACGPQQLMHFGGHEQLPGRVPQAGLVVTAVSCLFEEWVCDAQLLQHATQKQCSSQ